MTYEHTHTNIIYVLQALLEKDLRGWMVRADIVCFLRRASGEIRICWARAMGGGGRVTRTNRVPPESLCELKYERRIILRFCKSRLEYEPSCRFESSAEFFWESFRQLTKVVSRRK